MVGKERTVGKEMLLCCVCLALSMGLLANLHRQKMRMYLDCMGKNELFVFDLEQVFLPYVGGAGIKLKLYAPFRLTVNSISFAFILVVPCFYWKIFKFRKIQDSSVPGISLL